jgi:hypothetical protein
LNLACLICKIKSHSTFLRNTFYTQHFILVFVDLVQNWLSKCPGSSSSWSSYPSPFQGILLHFEQLHWVCAASHFFKQGYTLFQDSLCYCSSIVQHSSSISASSCNHDLYVCEVDDLEKVPTHTKKVVYNANEMHIVRTLLPQDKPQAYYFDLFDNRLRSRAWNGWLFTLEHSMLHHYGHAKVGRMLDPLADVVISLKRSSTRLSFLPPPKLEPWAQRWNSLTLGTRLVACGSFLAPWGYALEGLCRIMQYKNQLRRFIWLPTMNFAAFLEPL